MHWFDFLCHRILLVIIHDLNLIGVTLQPDKTNAPLLINTNAVLPFPIALQCFQSVPRQCRQRSDIRCGIQHVQFPQGLPLESLKRRHRFPLEESLGIRAAKGTDHRSVGLYCYPLNVKQYADA